MRVSKKVDAGPFGGMVLLSYIKRVVVGYSFHDSCIYSFPATIICREKRKVTKRTAINETEQFIRCMPDNGYNPCDCIISNNQQPETVQYTGDKRTIHATLIARSRKTRNQLIL